MPDIITDTYDSSEILASFIGQHIHGFADGTFVEVERNEDAMTLVVGADGEAVRSRSNNKSGRITFTLLQTSGSNDILSAFANADELTGLGIGPFFLKDNVGRTLVAAASAWVVKMPKVEYGKEQSNRVWVLEAANLNIIVGGGVIGG